MRTRRILQKISIATTKNYDSLIQKGITDYNFEIVELYELKHILEQMCSNLTAQEQQVLKLLYDDQLTLTRIGKQLHISESRVSQVKTKALKKLRTEENIKKLQDRNPEYNKIKISLKKSEKENVVQESMEVTQGKLIIGMDLDVDNEDLRYDIMIYNSIFGGSANSKLFQNVREKASLAYTASSSYYRFKNNIFINCGIEIKNYDKALEIIKQQIEDMKKGDFTEEEVENAKKGIIASIKIIDDEQDTEITYFFSQELSNSKCSVEQYMDNIKTVTKEKVIDIANKVSINTVYFLKD